MNYFYTDAQGNVTGPVTREQLQQFSDSGLLPDGSQACYEGSEDWQPVSQFIKQTKKPMPTAAKPAPSLKKSSAVATPPATPPAAPHADSITRVQGTVITVLLCIGVILPFVTFLRPIPRFEYKISSPSDYLFDTEMNALGKEGWEIISARRATSEFRSASYEVILKRPLR